MPPVPKPRPKHRTFLFEWRKHRGLTQEKAASRMEIDRTTLGRLEKGESPYDQAVLEAAAEAYSCEPADLLERDPNNPVWTIWEEVRALPATQQRQIAGMIRGFIESTKAA